ncbi:ankyrin repeat-containing protein [Achlya hypogyna]|uniref:Ankyrin repeat-containing protein n=1 Tax=Achlya hypogyna TaxID=1202772 RepID=A0A1V9ZLL4_ACHHY|nr:ankyrin repeat-containing protein [Achlya hypogyna]
MAGIAELAWRQAWDDVQKRLRQSPPVDVNEPFFGKSALHWAAYHGVDAVVAALAHVPTIDIDARDIENACTALHWAVLKASPAAVDALLVAGANVHATTTDGQTPLQMAIAIQAHTIAERLERAMATTAGAQSLFCTCQRIGARLSFIRSGDVAKVHTWLANDYADMDARDANDKTPLMLAATGGHHTIVELLLARDPDVDATDAMGRTALMHAALAGHPTIVDMLLGHFADIDTLDNEGRSVVELVQQALAEKGLSATEHARFDRCLSTLRKEIQYRETSAAYRMKIRSTILHRMEHGFDAAVFKMAVQCDPALARWCLNHALVIDRHSLGVAELDKIYGTRGIKKSALYTLLHVKDEDDRFHAKRLCLDHVVMRRVLHVKWELFGQRMFIERVLMYFLLVTSMTISSTLDIRDEEAATTITIFSVVNWAVVNTCLILGWLGAQALRPSVLYFVDGRLSPYDGLVHVSDAEKRKAKWIILGLTAAAALAVCIPFSWYLVDNVTGGWTPIFTRINLVQLWSTAAYFLYVEYREFVGDTYTDPIVVEGQKPTAAHSWKSSSYFSSVVNWWRLAVYLVIVCAYVPWELGLFGVGVPMEWHFCLGTTLSLSLWVLSLEFLQVYPTTGYLIPMIKGLLVDVGNFILLYGVLQWGLSCAFLHIVKPNPDESGLETWLRSFSFAYFALFGEFRLDQNFKTDNVVLFGYYRFLAQVQAAIASVLLLNMLIAMMNRRVMEGLDRAKIEALASYAKCILRLEMTMSPATQRDVMHLYDAEGQFCLNPIFHAAVTKSAARLSPEDIQTIDTMKTHQLSWRRVLESLQSLLLEQYAAWQQEATTDAHRAALETSEQQLLTQFSLYMNKPNVNLLSAPNLLAQLATALEQHVSATIGPWLAPHIPYLQTHVWPEFRAKGAQLAAHARETLNHDAQSALHGPVLAHDLRATEVRYQKLLEAHQAAFTEQLVAQRQTFETQLAEMERRLAALILAQRLS